MRDVPRVRMPPPSRLLALVAACLAAGCAGQSRDPITRAVVTAVTVEALPLDQDWDGTVSPGAPDVYVDVVDGAPPGPLGYRSVLVRTTVREDVGRDALPLALAVGTSTPLAVRAPLRIVVADRDSGGLDDDDDLFVTEIAGLASRIGDARAGDETVLRFGDGRTRVVLTVRWE